MNTKNYKENKISFSILILILLISFLIDIFWTKSINLVPAWDQGYHLSNLYSFSNALKNITNFSTNWWENFWGITDSYRGPLTYIISSIFLNIFGKNLHNAILSNLIFNVITLLSIYFFCKKFINIETGLWASFLYSFNPFIFNLRNDYLIDLPQVSFILLTWYFLSIWYLVPNVSIFIPILTGATFGLLFLTKPSGIFFLTLPFLLILKKNLLKKKISFLRNFLPLSFCFLSFLLIIYPWLSQNWLTILTSTINAFQWGIKYQDGLEINTIGGFLFYPIQLIKIINPINIFSILSLIILYKFKYQRKESKKNIFLNYKIISSRNIWFISAPLNISFLILLMSTKDGRFVLPLIPFLFFYIGKQLSKIENKFATSKFIKIFISINIISVLTISQLKLFSSNAVNANSIHDPNKIHKEIIEAVYDYSPYIDSTIGFIPDTRDFNAFNLDSEAIRLDKGVRVRQIVSNLDSFKKDLKLFDWFIIKTGDQGEMTSDSKEELSKYLSSSNSFEVYKKWKLNDDSSLKLIKRKELSQNLIFEECLEKKSKLNLSLLKNIVKINFKGDYKQIEDSYLLIDLIDNKNLRQLNFVTPKIKDIPSNSRCLNFTSVFESNLNTNYIENPVKIISSIYKRDQLHHERMQKINKVDNNISVKDKIFVHNKINLASSMGLYLKEGKFDELFNLAGLVNQSDPNQKYLKDTENIFNKRIDDEENYLDNLYTVAISQILQKKPNKANSTIDKILLIDGKNPNAYIAKALVNIYIFNISEANLSLAKAIEYNKNIEIQDTLKKVYSITKLLGFNFIEGFKELKS